jgi:hypothetical protein
MELILEVPFDLALIHPYTQSRSRGQARATLTNEFGVSNGCR